MFRARRAHDHFENHLTNLAARCRKKIENMKTIDSIITTNGSLRANMNQIGFKNQVFGNDPKCAYLHAKSR